jgi:hypothetical protein
MTASYAVYATPIRTPLCGTSVAGAETSVLQGSWASYGPVHRAGVILPLPACCAKASPSVETTRHCGQELAPGLQEPSSADS